MIASRTKSSAVNAGYGAIYQVAMVMLNFISRTIFIRTLGADYLGINGLFSDVLSMLCMADMGLNTAMVYSFYKPLAENDTARLAALTTFYQKVYYIIAGTITIAGLGLVPFLGYLVNLEQNIPYLRVFYLFFLANTVVSYLFVYKTSILTADQKNYIVTRYQIIINIIKICMQCIFLIVTKNYFSYLIILVFCTFLNNFLASRKAAELYPCINDTSYKIDENDRKGIFENIKSVFVYKVSTALFIGTDNALISVLIGTTYVGLYSNYVMITNTLTNVVKIFYNAVTASIGNANVTETPERRYSIFNQLSIFNMIVSPTCAICLWLLLSDFIRLWMGNEYVFDNLILCTIVLNFYVSVIQYPVWVHREAVGIFKKTKYIMLIAAVINIILSIILGRWIGIAGIFLGTIIARLTTYFWYEPIVLLSEHMNANPFKYLGSIGLNAIITVLLCLGFTEIFSRFEINTWFSLVVKAVVVFCGSVASMLVIYWKNPNTHLLIGKIIYLLKKIVKKF